MVSSGDEVFVPGLSPQRSHGSLSAQVRGEGSYSKPGIREWPARATGPPVRWWKWPLCFESPALPLLQLSGLPWDG